MNTDIPYIDPELSGTLTDEQKEKYNAAIDDFVSFIFREQKLTKKMREQTQSMARLTFPVYLRRYGKIIDLSDITEKALELDPAAYDLKAAVIEAQNAPQDEQKRNAVIEMLDQINTPAFMEIFRHFVKDEDQETDPDQAPTYKQFQKTELAERFSFPVDKVNRNFVQIWELIADAPENQMFFDVTPQRQANKIAETEKSYIFLALENRGTKAKPLTEYDKRVMIAAQALYEENKGRPFSLQAVYEQMGNDGKLGGINRARILESLESLNSYWIHIDNAEEAKNLHGRKEYKYHGSLLPFEYAEELENGQVTKTHVRLLRSAPLMEFSQDRKQFTTISRQLLKTPVNHTNTNLQIEDYLISEIAGMKKGRRSNKMLFNTIFEETGQTGRKQRERAKEKILALLAYYQKIEHIIDYKIKPDGIEIIYSKNTPSDKPKRRRKKTA